MGRKEKGKRKDETGGGIRKKEGREEKKKGKGEERRGRRKRKGEFLFM